MVHELKTWSEYFQEVKAGKKTFEVRKNDRNFKVGDTLVLKEWKRKGYSSVNPNELEGEYTGDEIRVEVTYLLTIKPEHSSFIGIGGDVAVMAIQKEGFDPDAEFLDRLVNELPEHGVDTSDWEYKYGDCCYTAAEFIARAFKDVSDHPETPVTA